MSCNGCRVLRKGCSESCVLRQCLRPIQGRDAQSHATAFVAKFFGRATMMAFINAVPERQRPELFQSLLYEACGRTVDPVHGSVGLLCSGNWHACQMAVQTVLRGGSLSPPSAEALNNQPITTSLYIPTLLPPLEPPEGLSNDFYESISWQTHPRAGGPACFVHGGQQGVPTVTLEPQSPSGSIFHPLPVKRKRHMDLQSEVKEKLPDSQSLSAGSIDEHQSKSRGGVQEKYQQQQHNDLVNPWRSTKVILCKQEQVSEQLHQQQYFSDEDVDGQCLELTLSTNPCYSLTNPPSKRFATRRSSDPSFTSIESEGSVSSLDSTQVSKTGSINPQFRILDLLH